MENNYSNYEILDKLVANNKKAKSWTAFWVIILCLMAGAVLWLANTVAEKNRTISLKDREIEATNLNLEAKSLIIDSLTANCNADKTAIIKDYDSVITQTQATLTMVANEASAGSNANFTPVQQEKIKEATYSINKIQDEIKIVKADIRKITPRLFIQYNNKEATGRIEKMIGSLKSGSRYVVAPPEFINSSYPTIIKFYNYKNETEEKALKEMLARYMDVPVEDIRISHEENPKIRNTVEIWIGTRDDRQRVQQVMAN
jgi:hypothetical protein